MIEIKNLAQQYLHMCTYQKNLSDKTIKAYKIDLEQFSSFILDGDHVISRTSISMFIMSMHTKFKPKTINRKIASIKSFSNYLLDEEIIVIDPFIRLNTKIKEPLILPKTIPLEIIQLILQHAYQNYIFSKTQYQKMCNFRNIILFELLFSTGMRVSELVNLNTDSIDLTQGIIRIFGKGSKERIVHIGNSDVLDILKKYSVTYAQPRDKALFTNRLHQRLSEQSVRIIINNYTNECNIDAHITPHMFRHSFATLMLEQEVDIRYIQKILGHSSIVTTQIYTHVSNEKQKEILTNKHPRNKMNGLILLQ